MSYGVVVPRVVVPRVVVPGVVVLEPFLVLKRHTCACLRTYVFPTIFRVSVSPRISKRRGRSKLGSRGVGEVLHPKNSSKNYVKLSQERNKMCF